jgi:hypothetical protein
MIAIAANRTSMLAPVSAGGYSSADAFESPGKGLVGLPQDAPVLFEPSRAPLDAGVL